MKSYKESFTQFIYQLQNDICSALETSDGRALFKEDKWERLGGGGGRTRVITQGDVFEKGGVNISEVYGELPESMMSYLQTPHRNFFACGISLVIHPINPFVPTVHANYRYFELYDNEQNVVDQWFAGGSDLTPYYLFEEDAIHFHQTQKGVCDHFDSSFYPKYKKACDEYFFNKHRGEARGIGGIFYDDFAEGGAEHGLALTRAVGDAFLQAYLPIVQRRLAMPWGERERQHQLYRRGRYVEFNLVWDRGTHFGLQSGGRTESILMSLPPLVRWEYGYAPDTASAEARLADYLRPRDWLKELPQ